MFRNNRTRAEDDVNGIAHYEGPAGQRADVPLPDSDGHFRLTAHHGGYIGTGAGSSGGNMGSPDVVRDNLAAGYSYDPNVGWYRSR